MGTGVHPSYIRLVVLFFWSSAGFFRNHSGMDSTNKNDWVSPGGTCSMKRPSIDVCRTGWHDIWVNLEGKRWRSCHRIGRFKSESKASDGFTC